MTAIGDFFINLWNNIVMITVTASFTAFAINFMYNHIISKEIDRGGEDHGERAVSKIGRWAVAFMIVGGLVVVGVIAIEVMDLFGIELKR